jgi:hypothetical protein
MTSFSTPTRFHLLNEFVFPILPKVPNIAECANIAEFFCQKTFGNIAPRLYITPGNTYIVVIDIK